MHVLSTSNFKLFSRRGTEIETSQPEEISPTNQNQFRQYEKYPIIAERTRPLGMFNCHGMTFGSRRCWIDDVATLIEEDCLVEVVPNRVMPGDIALYYSSEFGDWEHSAIVIASGAGPFFIPTVVSKWGAWREVIHLANSSPYNFGGIRYFRIDS